MVVKNDFKDYHKFVKGLSDKHVVVVGVIAERANRQDAKDGLTNADLGAIHEFGVKSKGIPARSWLRMPLKVKRDYIMKFASKGMKRLIAEGRMTDVLERLGLACESAIDWAFFSSGFGSWAPDKPDTVKAKKSSRPLIDHGFLRGSVASKVVEKR